MLLPLTFSSMAIAQNDFQRIFDDFQKANEKEFSDFRDKANAEYSEFLRKAWELFEGKAPVPKPEQDEPVVPPVVAPEDDKEEMEDKELSYEDVVPEVEPAPAPKPLVPIESPPEPVEKYVTFSMYGTVYKMMFDDSTKPFLTNVNEYSIADFWNELYYSESMDNLLYECFNVREKSDLCDWAFYKMTEALSRKLYPYSQDEASLLQAYLMIQSGFKLRIGYSDDDGHIHFIICPDSQIYGYPFWEMGQDCYYLLDGSDVETMRLVAVDYESSLPMRMMITQRNILADNLSEVRHMQSDRYPDVRMDYCANLNMIAFYDEYPESMVNNDSRTRWRFYAEVPAGYRFQLKLNERFVQPYSTLSELEKVERILNFVQTAFVYEYDDKIWGGDRAFFPEETLYYPYCDCEDRSILFSRMVRDAVGLDVALIYYPGHLAAAVKFNEPVSGDYIVVDGKRYTICDPTYINAPVGMTMPDMDNSTAYVILL